jgi:hypothetical protein
MGIKPNAKEGCPLALVSRIARGGCVVMRLLESIQPCNRQREDSGVALDKNNKNKQRKDPRHHNV